LWSLEDENAAKVVRDADGNHTGDIRIALHMYSGSSERMWPRTKFTQLLTELSIFYGDRIHFFLVGAPDEYESNNQVIETLPPRIRVSNVAGKILLQQLPAFLAEMDVFIGNDSGPKHIADAVNVPIVAMFILGLSQAHATQNERSVIFTTKDDTQSIDTIEVSVVLEAVKNLIYNSSTEVKDKI
jgi:ADP-heptose:LPS heptosyltransferase